MQSNKQRSHSSCVQRSVLIKVLSGYCIYLYSAYWENPSTRPFFVSFLADVLGDIINSIQSVDHQVMLILPEREDLIEVVADGARNHWARDDYRLTPEEHARISIRDDVAGTRWQVVDLHNPDLHVSYKNKLILESVSIFLVFVTIALLLVLRLRREERQREFAEQQKQALISVVGHEFRSPTSVIKSALDLIADGHVGEVSADVKEFIDIASSSTSRLLLLVDDFLDIQKIESGNLKFDKQECQLNSVVANTVESNRLYAE